MNTENQRPEDTNEEFTPSAADEAEAKDAFSAEEPEATPELSEEDSSVLQTRIIELEADIASIKDKAMRALADAENTRKRAEREKVDASKFAITKFAKDLLEVADNMRRALDSIPEDRREESDLIKNIVIGIEAVDKTLLKTMENHGVKKLEPTEGKFDPNFHEAMFEAEIPGKNAGEIIQLVEPGYILNDRLLRPARVGVSKASATGNEPQGIDEKA
ncbi:MAG TPA: nucleotide exchange factor GrpE [Rhodospirillaceae bacterium]|nr:nucleotide exchange factor GrpE [Rhodospirillaceae bacterium]